MSTPSIRSNFIIKHSIFTYLNVIPIGVGRDNSPPVTILTNNYYYYSR